MSTVPDGGCAAWTRVVAYAVICTSTLGVMYAFSPLYALLLDELQSPPFATAFVGSLASGMMDGTSVLTGIMIERFGYRKTCMAGGLIASGGMAFSAFATELWQLYLSFGLGMGLGISLAFFPPIVLMSSWFDKRLSLVHSIGNSASAALALVFGPTATPIFESIGRRNAMLGLAAVMFVLLLCSSAVMTTPPQAPQAPAALAADKIVEEQKKEQRGPSSSKTSSSSSLAPFRSAIQKNSVRLTCLISFVYGLACWVPIVHLVRLSLDCGLESNEANTKLTFLALGSLTIRVPIAMVADRYGRRLVFLICALAYAAVCVVTAFAAGGDGCLQDVAASSAYLSAYAYLCGLTGAMNSLLVSLPSELGLSVDDARASVTLIVSPLGAGLLVGPVVAGALYGVTDRYREPLLVAAGCLLLAAAGILVQLRCTACKSADTRKIQPCDPAE